MKYVDITWQAIKRFFIMIWNFLSLFFGFPYEQQAKKLKDYDARGEDNPKRKYTAYRANKVSKS
jgi:hypothetical protein